MDWRSRFELRALNRGVYLGRFRRKYYSHKALFENIVKAIIFVQSVYEISRQYLKQTRRIRMQRIAK